MSAPSLTDRALSALLEGLDKAAMLVGYVVIVATVALALKGACSPDVPAECLTAQQTEVGE